MIMEENCFLNSFGGISYSGLCSIPKFVKREDRKA